MAAKLWATGKGTVYLVLALVAYACCSGAWMGILHANNGDLIKASSIWVSGGALAAALVAVLVFQERLTALNWLGVALSLAGAILVSRRG